MLEPQGTERGGSATSCCARWPPNWRLQACGASCTPKSPTLWSRARPATPTGDWSPPTTRHAERYTDAASAYQQASTDARRRGALDEARTYLTRAITQLESAPPDRDRDRREIAARLERGFLAAAAEGYQSPSVVADFERCLQLAGTDLRDDQLFATLLALCSYYISARRPGSGMPSCWSYC